MPNSLKFMASKITSLFLPRPILKLLKFPGNAQVQSELRFQKLLIIFGMIRSFNRILAHLLIDNSSNSKHKQVKTRHQQPASIITSKYPCH